MGIKIDEANKIIDLAKSRKDGVYSKGAWLYSVKNKSAVMVGNKYSLEILQFSGNFTVGLSPAQHSWTLKKELQDRLSRV